MISLIGMVEHNFDFSGKLYPENKTIFLILSVEAFLSKIAY